MHGKLNVTGIINIERSLKLSKLPPFRVITLAYNSNSDVSFIHYIYLKCKQKANVSESLKEGHFERAVEL